MEGEGVAGGPESQKRCVVRSGCRLALLVALWVCVAVVVTGVPSRAGAADWNRPDRRALFDEAFSWITPGGARALVKRAHDAGFNSIVVCVWHGRGASWPSESLPLDARYLRIREKHPDPFAYLLSEAKSQGLEVHAWFTVALRQADIYPEYYDGVGYTDEIRRSFNVHRPQFRALVRQTVDEFLTRYDVDGINLDYIRAMGVCTSDYCVTDYRERTGRDLLVDVEKLHKSREAWASISRWNGVAVTDIVKQIREVVDRRKPKAVLSVDSHIGKRTLERQGVDNVAWLNGGLIDVVFDMNYEEQLDLDRLARVREQLNDGRRMVLLIGNYDQSLADRRSVWPREARSVRALWLDALQFGRAGAGAAVYDYSFLSDAQIAMFREAAKSQPVR